jgi:hypothetical protein
MKIAGPAALLLTLVLAGESSLPACTVFFVFDGTLSLAGSNEDWADPNTQMWFVPPSKDNDGNDNYGKDNYGIVYFGFGRGEYPPGGARGHKLKIPEEGITKINPEDLYGLPQAGMNEKGLFFDGASTDVIKAAPARGKKEYDGRLEDLILRKCATVAEALKLLDTYAFNLVQGQWMFADKTGDSFIIEAGETIVRKKGNYQVMTNFLESKVKAAAITCPRYKLVSQSLNERRELSVDGVRSLLKATVQKGSAYSTIFDLTHGEVYLHHRGGFERTVKITLKDELGKGKRVLKIASLFKQ